MPDTYAKHADICAKFYELTVNAETVGNFIFHKSKAVSGKHALFVGGMFGVAWEGMRKVPFSTISDSIDLNLKAHIRITQALLPLFASASLGDRSITYLSSINALLDCGGPGYSAAKAGLLGFVRACTSELGKDGIRVNAVLPGTVPTPNTVVDRTDLGLMLEKTALGRLTTPQEVAEVIYALTQNMTCITGQFIVADCGQSARC